MSADLARRKFLDTFRWVDGHADVWRVFADAEVFSVVIAGLVDPWRSQGVTKVVGVESRGFLLGGAAAVDLGAGFAAIRKSDGLLPGAKVTVDTAPDYRSRNHRLRLQRVLTPDDRVLVVDDWAERGSQASAARDLVRAAGATYLGLGLLVDQLPDEARSLLGRVTSLVRADELGPPD